MKHRKALTALVLALALVGAFSLVSYAAEGLQEISAYLNSNISIKLDGETKTLTDATGVRTYPITYNGTTYVPLRSVANLLGINVDWDQATQTVLLGTTPTDVDLINDFKPYTSYRDPDGYIYDYTIFSQSSDGKSETVGGVTIDHWLLLHSFKYGGGGGGEKEITCSFNIGGKYNTLTFQVYSNEDTTLTVKGDNDSVLGQFSLVGGQTPQTFNVDLQNTTQLTFIRGKAIDTASGVVYPAIDTYIFDAKLS